MIIVIIAEVCHYIVEQDITKQIGLLEKTVEIDESKFGKRKYHHEGQWASGAFCRETHQVFLMAVENWDMDTLLAITEEYIAPGSNIIMDIWRAYSKFLEWQKLHAFYCELFAEFCWYVVMYK